jgi:hypothetical protein
LLPTLVARVLFGKEGPPRGHSWRGVRNGKEGECEPRDPHSTKTLAQKFPANHFAGVAFFFLSGTQHSPETRTGGAMSDVARTQRRARTLSCPRCGTAMEAIVTIEPTLGQPGLIGYECPKCVYVTSELVQPIGSAKPVH